MGCYGIGISRVMGVIAEKYCDNNGLIWPESIAPFKYYLIGIGEQGAEQAEELYQQHTNDILFDDRNLRPGEKFHDAELLGIPYRIVISDRSLEKSEVELTDRRTGETKNIQLTELQKLINQ